MKVILLAAGFGTRLRPLTDTVPKCMVPIRGKPLLAYWLDTLFTQERDVERVLINTHYLPGPVREFVANSPWVNGIDLVHESELLGTAGTVWRNREWIGKDDFMLAHADNLTRFNLRTFLKAHQQRPIGTVISMMTFTTDAPRSCGIVETDHSGVVQHFHEKVSNPPGDRANAAVYIIGPEVVSFIGSIGREFVDFSTEVLPLFLGRIFTWHNSDYHRDIGTPESLLLAEREF